MISFHRLQRLLLLSFALQAWHASAHESANDEVCHLAVRTHLPGWHRRRRRPCDDQLDSQVESQAASASPSIDVNVHLHAHVNVLKVWNTHLHIVNAAKSEPEPAPDFFRDNAKKAKDALNAGVSLAATLDSCAKEGAGSKDCAKAISSGVLSVADSLLSLTKWAEPFGTLLGTAGNLLLSLVFGTDDGSTEQKAQVISFDDLVAAAALGDMSVECGVESVDVKNVRATLNDILNMASTLVGPKVEDYCATNDGLQDYRESFWDGFRTQLLGNNGIQVKLLDYADYCINTYRRQTVLMGGGKKPVPTPFSSQCAADCWDGYADHSQKCQEGVGNVKENIEKFNSSVNTFLKTAGLFASVKAVMVSSAQWTGYNHATPLTKSNFDAFLQGSTELERWSNMAKEAQAGLKQHCAGMTEILSSTTYPDSSKHRSDECDSTNMYPCDYSFVSVNHDEQSFSPPYGPAFSECDWDCLKPQWCFESASSADPVQVSLGACGEVMKNTTKWTLSSYPALSQVPSSLSYNLSVVGIRALGANLCLSYDPNLMLTFVPCMTEAGLSAQEKLTRSRKQLFVPNWANEEVSFKYPDPRAQNLSVAGPLCVSGDEPYTCTSTSVWKSVETRPKQYNFQLVENELACLGMSKNTYTTVLVRCSSTEAWTTFELFTLMAGEA